MILKFKNERTNDKEKNTKNRQYFFKNEQWAECKKTREMSKESIMEEDAIVIWT